MLLLMVWKNRELKWHGKRLFATAVGCALFFALDLVMYHKSIHYVGPGLDHLAQFSRICTDSIFRCHFR